MLMRGDAGRAGPLLEEGRRLADEVQRQVIQFRARLLEAHFLAKTGRKEDAYQKLGVMLSEMTDGGGREGEAQIYYELWQIEHESEYAHKALTAYQTAATRVEKAEYRTRIEELGKYLATQDLHNS